MKYLITVFYSVDDKLRSEQYDADDVKVGADPHFLLRIVDDADDAVAMYAPGTWHHFEVSKEEA